MLRKHKEDPDEDDDSSSEDELFPGSKVKKEKKEEEQAKRGTKRPSSSSANNEPNKKPKVDVVGILGISEKDFEIQVRDAILVRGKVSTGELVAKFKTKIKGSEEVKGLFTAIIKRIGVPIKEDGVTYIMLKEDATTVVKGAGKRN